MPGYDIPVANARLSRAVT